jgi:hypothetical protein
LVEAPNIEEARKIADESCGSEWKNLDAGDWNIDHDLTEEISPSHVESPHYEAYWTRLAKRVAELEAAPSLLPLLHTALDALVEHGDESTEPWIRDQLEKLHTSKPFNKQND